MATKVKQYTEASIRSLDWREHIRLRPGMYIGKMGDGSSPDDGIYVLLKETIDNSIDEFMMGFGKAIEVKVTKHSATVRDYGRGIPLGKVYDCVAKINTGGKYDSEVFQKSIGLNGIGSKAVNALSKYFKVQSIRDGKIKTLEFENGILKKDHKITKTDLKNGTIVYFEPDPAIFKNFQFRSEFIENQMKNYVYLNAGLTIVFNGKRFQSKNGLFDLLNDKLDQESLRYPIIHFRGKDIEIAFTHTNQYGEDYYSFVNGQYTPQGGTHLAAFREGIIKTIREFYKKNFDATDIRASIAAAISIRIQEPVFESQTKTKLGSTHLSPDGTTVRNYILDFIKTELDNYLHRNTETAELLLKKIQQSEHERKELAGIKKLATQRAKKANLHNKKLRDCRIHYSDTKDERRFESTIFITEGDSASGSITKARDVQTQAVFSLRGKPLNCFGLSKKVVYQNEEFNLLQHALNIENGLEGLRYNHVVIATDADVDGMHIRLLLMTFFLQFFPDLVRAGHVYILETPLFRVRNKQKTIYCYSEEERQQAVNKLGKGVEITRFKGLGEISPDEFRRFVREDIRLEPLVLDNKTQIQRLLNYYMGKNTQDRQEFIIDNLRVEKDLILETA
ncbi:MAG: type IIA DNA topoisomerase subunit B [Calditrichaeota bacterium]|nr:type IIA DNA topoisomerase subunit B [Calditrichota bacterium]